MNNTGPVKASGPNGSPPQSNGLCFVAAANGMSVVTVSSKGSRTPHRWLRVSAGLLARVSAETSTATWACWEDSGHRWCILRAHFRSVREIRREATLATPDKRRVSRRGAVSAALHDRIAARRTIADQTISLAHLLGRRVLDAAGTRVGKVSDVVVRWDANVTYPPVVGILVGVGSGFAFVDLQDVTLTQTGARLRSEQQTVSRPVRGEGEVALARDVLDRQLVDVAGVQVVRAADVYLLNGPRGWELAGIDVGVRAFGRRLLPKRRTLSAAGSCDRVGRSASVRSPFHRYRAAGERACGCGRDHRWWHATRTSGVRAQEAACQRCGRDPRRTGARATGADDCPRDALGSS